MTGKLELFGKPVETKFTRLTANAKVGQNTISVISASGWAAGDEIAVGPTGKLAAQGEKFKILSISGTTVTLNDTIKFFHYGDAKTTAATDSSGLNQISADFGGGLDMRAIVGHLTRNIKIQGSETDNWGGHIYVYHWIDNTQQINTRGTIWLESVELYNMGKRDVEKAGIQFFNTNTDGDTSIVRDSSIHDCVGQCVHAEYSYQVEFSQNVFFNGIKHFIFNLKYKDWDIFNNVFISVKKRILPASLVGIYDPVAAIYMFDAYNPDLDSLSVTGNSVQGSESIGMAIPSVDCTKKAKNAFTNNEVGVCEQVGVIVNHPYGSTVCGYFGSIAVYNAEKCLMHNGNTDKGILLDKVRAAECKNAVLQRIGTTVLTNYGTFENS